MAYTPLSNAPSTPTPPATDPPETLVWTTVVNGPSRQIVDQWTRYARRPAILRHVNAWEFMPRRVEHLDEVIISCGNSCAWQNTTTLLPASFSIA